MGNEKTRENATTQPTAKYIASQGVVVVLGAQYREASLATLNVLAKQEQKWQP